MYGVIMNLVGLKIIGTLLILMSGGIVVGTNMATSGAIATPGGG
jgi:hypothetical protein